MRGLQNMAGSTGSTFGLKATGKEPIAVTDKPGANTITAGQMRDLPPSSTGRWMFEEAARANGFNPATIIKGSAEDQRVTETLDRALLQMRDAPKVYGGASEVQQLRGIIADAAKPPLMPTPGARTLAFAPGAGAFAASDLVAAESTALAAARTAAVTAPELAAAAGVGFAAGAGLAYAAGSLRQSDERSSPVAGMQHVGESRRDDRCAPQGTTGNWVVLNRNGMKPDAIAYQEQIARMPSVPGGVIEYNVTNTATGQTVNFDGCAYWSPKHELLEAKKGYDSLYEASDRHGFPVKADASMRQQVARQTGIARGNPVEWHFSNPTMARQLGAQAQAAALPGSNFSVHYTPAAR